MLYVDLKTNEEEQTQEKEQEYKLEEIIDCNKLIECTICRTNTRERTGMQIYNASCNHNYCYLCLTKHYKTSIENGIVSFVCMEQECDRSIDKKELFLFINEMYKNKYYKFLRNVQLAKDPTIRWCVSAGCDTPIKRKSRKQIKLECPKCNCVVCYQCAGLYYNISNKNKNNNTQNHTNHDCNKGLDDALVNWAKTKSYDVQFCPKCGARIEKLSGCNHLKCTYCKYEFCWLCRNEFKNGHYDPKNILFGCPGGENATKKINKCSACCKLFLQCVLMCCLPFRICCWRMQEQGFPWCCCWCCF
eukprot:427488_1